MKEKNHTPTPWLFDGEFIYDSNEVIIADPYCRAAQTTELGEMEANAEFICHAVNSYEKLVSVLQRAKGHVEAMMDSTPEEVVDFMTHLGEAWEAELNQTLESLLPQKHLK